MGGWVNKTSRERLKNLKNNCATTSLEWKPHSEDARQQPNQWVWSILDSGTVLGLQQSMKIKNKNILSCYY